MKFKLSVLVMAVALVFASCGDDKKKTTTTKVTKKVIKKRAPKKEVATKNVSATKKEGIPVDMNNKGIGPVKSLTLGAIDQSLVATGKKLYKNKCSACHKIKKRFIGPALKGVTKRRSPEWIMNMILNPEEMIAKDPITKALIAEYNAPMANQSLTEKGARAILEYFRTKN